MFINTTCSFTLVYKEKAWACLWIQLASLCLSSSSSHGNTKSRPTYQQVFLFIFFCHMSCFHLRPYYTLLSSYVTLDPPSSVALSSTTSVGRVETSPREPLSPRIHLLEIIHGRRRNVYRPDMIFCFVFQSIFDFFSVSIFSSFLRLLGVTKKNHLSTQREKMKWSIEDRLCNINHNPDEDWEQDRQSRIEREIEMEEEEKEWFSVQYPDKEREPLMRCPVETCHVPVLTNSKAPSFNTGSSSFYPFWFIFFTHLYY